MMFKNPIEPILKIFGQNMGRNLKPLFQDFLSQILKLVAGKWSNYSKIWHDWSLYIVLQNDQRNFWNFDFSRFFGRFGCSVAQKTPFFPISAAVKSAKIEISKFPLIIFCVYLQGSCVLIFRSIGPFSRD